MLHHLHLGTFFAIHSFIISRLLIYQHYRITSPGDGDGEAVELHIRMTATTTFQGPPNGRGLSYLSSFWTPAPDRASITE